MRKEGLQPGEVCVALPGGSRGSAQRPDCVKCYMDDFDAHWHSALGATLAVLEAGYNIASIMLRYKGVDWRDMSTWDCNRRISPLGELAYACINLHPRFELSRETPHQLMPMQRADTPCLLTPLQTAHAQSRRPA